MTVEEKFVVLFGPSGSGKTPTLHTIARLSTLEAGRVAFNSRVPHDSRSRVHVPARQRNAEILDFRAMKVPSLSY